jgi:hypothetical protein
MKKLDEFLLDRFLGVSESRVARFQNQYKSQDKPDDEQLAADQMFLMDLADLRKNVYDSLEQQFKLVSESEATFNSERMFFM